MSNYNFNEVNNLRIIKPNQQVRPRVDDKNDISFRQVLDRQSDIKFSKHANERIRQRRIPIGNDLKAQICQAVEKAEKKGLKEVLVIGKQGTFIVNVKNKTVITSIAPDETKQSVFTNIDGAVFI